MRIDKRRADQLRPIKITPNFLKNPHGSALIEFGNTRIVCAATVSPELPGWMRAKNIEGGWITGEYQMLPASTVERSRREIGRGPSGRTHEIQRLIGRSLRSAVDLKKLGSRTIYIDCDVLDADGGTRCASITGGMVALRMAILKLLKDGLLDEDPVKFNIAAVSLGIVDKKLLLDLSYEEDSKAEVDLNIIMADDGRLIEIQATAEREPFSRNELNSMLKLADSGIKKLLEAQRKALAIS